MLLACCGSAAMAQISLQQAMLRAPVTTSAAGDDSVAAFSPATSVAGALQEVARQAAVIFTGSVSSVTPDPAGGAKITFAVEQGVRGVASGSRYTMHVTAWGGGAERYFPGERALFLLTAPSAAGYSAPVMGERGIVPQSGDALVGNLDLRWIATDVQRAQESLGQGELMSASVRSASVTAMAAAPQPADVKSEQGSTPSTVSLAGMPDVHAIDRDLLLDLLRNGNAAMEQAR